jgi:hypothetical protein
MDDNLDNPWHRGELTFSIEGALKTEKGQRPDYLRGVSAKPLRQRYKLVGNLVHRGKYMETAAFLYISVPCPRQQHLAKASADYL